MYVRPGGSLPSWCQHRDANVRSCLPFAPGENRFTGWPKTVNGMPSLEVRHVLPAKPCRTRVGDKEKAQYVGAVRLPSILVLTIDGLLSAQCLFLTAQQGDGLEELSDMGVRSPAAASDY